MFYMSILIGFKIYAKNDFVHSEKELLFTWSNHALEENFGSTLREREPNDSSTSGNLIALDKWVYGRSDIKHSTFNPANQDGYDNFWLNIFDLGKYEIQFKIEKAEFNTNNYDFLKLSIGNMSEALFTDSQNTVFTTLMDTDVLGKQTLILNPGGYLIGVASPLVSQSQTSEYSFKVSLKEKIQTYDDGFKDGNKSGFESASKLSALASMQIFSLILSDFNATELFLKVKENEPTQFFEAIQKDLGKIKLDGQKIGENSVISNPAAFNLVPKSSYDQALLDANVSAEQAITDAKVGAKEEGQNEGIEIVKTNPTTYGLYSSADLNASIANAKSEGESYVISDPAAYSLVTQDAYEQMMSDLMSESDSNATHYTEDWFYHPSRGWMWTDRSAYPYFYDATDKDWMYFQSGNDKPKFYRYKTKTWLTVE